MIKPIYVDLPGVANLVTLATATIQHLVMEGAFLKPRQLSANRVAWLVREVEAWAEDRPASEIPPPKNSGRRKKSDTEIVFFARR